jgi:D-3-phosphoglycerate dehydrogenase / 2-oxoglutarate reductase
MNILILGDLGLSTERLGRLHQVFCWSDTGAGPPAEICSECDLIVVRSPHQVPAELIAAATRLRWIVRAGSGTDNIAMQAAAARGIRVLTTPSSGGAIAELAFALLLAVARQIPWLDASLRKGEWQKNDAHGQELEGKTMLVVGFGRIGRRIARIAEGFGVRVLINDRSPDKQEKACLLAQLPNTRVIGLEAGLAQADMVVLCCPLTPETRHLMNADRFGLLRRGAILVNVARGGVVDEAALEWALDQGILSGAGIDTFAVEPPIENRLLRRRQIVATPHIGAQTAETRERIGAEVERLISLEIESTTTEPKPAAVG